MLKTLFALDGDAPRSAPPGPVPSAQDLREECIARMGIYRLLSAVFIEEPGREFLAALRQPEALASLADAGLAFDDDVTASDPDALVERLSCEYTTLFAASGGFPPVESVRLTGRYKQEPHFQVGQI